MHHLTLDISAQAFISILAICGTLCYLTWGSLQRGKGDKPVK
jgi:hypothetical protein